MKRVRNKKKKTLIIVALLVLITMGYAYISQVLAINGTGSVDNMDWDIHFESYNVTGNSNIVPATEPSTAGNNKTSLTYAVTFDTPGQVYEFTVDTVNAGSLDAMIKSYTSTIQVGSGEVKDATVAANIPNYLIYRVTYADDTAIANNHLLAANSFEKIKVHVEFNRNISAAELTTAKGQTTTLTITANYEQTDGSETVPHPEKDIYRWSTTSWTTNQDISSFTAGTDYVTDKNQVKNMNALAEKFFLKYHIENNQVTDKYVCFVVTSAMVNAHTGMTAGEYCIQGGDGGTTFLDNAKTIWDAFGSDNCTGGQDPYGTFTNSLLRCGVTEFSAYANNAGLVEVDTNAGGSTKICYVNADGSSYCTIN